MKLQKMRKVLTLAIASLMVIALLTACGNGNGTNAPEEGTAVNGNGNGNDTSEEDLAANGNDESEDVAAGDDVYEATHRLATDIADETMIKNDLTLAIGSQNGLFEGETITSVNIDRRQTDENDRLDRIWVSVGLEDDIAVYERFFILTYGLYDDAGWMLDLIERDRENDWTETPTRGADEEMIREGIYPRFLNFTAITEEGNRTRLTRDNLYSFDIISRDTDLENKTDLIDVDVLLQIQVDSEILQRTFRYTISLAFTDRSWVRSAADSYDVDYIDF